MSSLTHIGYSARREPVHKARALARADRQLAPDTIVGGRYRLLRKIGQGGMGDVYSAEHLFLKRQVAIKILHRTTTDPNAKARFSREARLASKVCHPNLVVVQDFGYCQSGHTYLVMELLEGTPLSKELRRGPIGLLRVLGIAEKVCAGLAAVHAHGIVHRDIKPGNIFLAHGSGGRDEDEVKVLDFGLAKDHECLDASLTLNGTFVGTPAYMSPEQARGRPIDPRSDIYALGALLYELCVGQPPFQSPRFIDVLEMHESRAPVLARTAAPGAGIPVALETLIDRCLAKRPADRPASAGELQAELRRIADQVLGITPINEDRPTTASGEILPRHSRGLLAMVSALIP